MLGNSDDDRTLFVGDLSIYCGEADLEQLFAQFGPIEKVTLKRGSSATTNLSYGFVKFLHRESAEAATVMKGFVFMGRSIRIGRAGPKVADKPLRSKEGPTRRDTAQIHVSFISKQVDALITEETLRSLFSHYGTVVDVAIKKSKFDQNLKVQNGYGFIHYSLTSEGIQSAITATREVHQITVDRVIYDCTLSHLLESYLTPEQIAFAYSSPTPPEFKGRPYERKREMYSRKEHCVPPLYHTLPPSTPDRRGPEPSYQPRSLGLNSPSGSFFDTIGFDEVSQSSQSSASGMMSHLSSWESSTFSSFLGGGNGTSLMSGTHANGSFGLECHGINRKPLDLYNSPPSDRVDLSKLLGLPEPSSPNTSHSATSQSRLSEDSVLFSLPTNSKPSLFPSLPDLSLDGPVPLSTINDDSFFRSWYSN